jgi:3',5'-cyclic AMP phosphodiesterase CpdA
MKKIILFILAFALMSTGGLALLYRNANAFQFEEPSGPASAGTPWTASVVADPHYLSPQLHDDGEAFSQFLHYSDKLVHLSEEILDVLVWETTRSQPDFLFLAGDLTCNGEKISHQELAGRLHEIERSGTAVYVIPGNHDIQNPLSRQYFGVTPWETPTITKEEFADIYSEYGFSEAISRDNRSLSYLVAPTEDTWFLMLDSAIYSYNMENNISEQEGELYESTLNWIRQCGRMAARRGAEMIAIMHHSLIHHSNQINQGYTIKNDEAAMKVFHSAGIELVLTGHIHLQNVETHSQDGRRVTDVATGSLMVYPNQYGWMDYRPDSGILYQTRRLDASGYAAEMGLVDTELNQLEEVACEFFVNQCCKRQNRALEEIPDLTEEEREMVKYTVSSMNLRYFAGYRNENLAELTKTEGFKILMDLPPFFVQDYIQNMLQDDRSDHNVFFLPKR